MTFLLENLVVGFFGRKFFSPEFKEIIDAPFLTPFPPFFNRGYRTIEGREEGPRVIHYQFYSAN